MKYFIISQPKAGTYLLSNILENMGIIPSKLHFDPNLVRRFTTLEDYERLNIPLNRAVIKLLKENEFAVGHLTCGEKEEEALQNVKKILITRNTKGIKESALRYFKETGIDVGEIVSYRNLMNIKKWRRVKEVFHITFEDIIKKDTRKINKLQMFLFNEIRFNSLEIINKSLEQESLTKSSIRS
jgi:hypothetical protein